MDELIVRVLRTVACFTRLRILSRLSAKDTAPTTLARDLGLSVDLVCSHLARLSSVGLVRRRRSGLHCYCSAGSPYSDSALSGQIAGWVHEALRGAAPGAPAPGRSARRRAKTADTSPDASDLLFDAATAFTNVRRLQIMRRLAKGEPADAPTLARELRMSAAAVGRHLSKLIRRGFVRSSSHKGRMLYQLVPNPRTPLHARLLAIVSAYWSTQRLRT
jgi:DNA-binding MarR family transcriptional regulator